MLRAEEALFDEYKRVDNICRDMFLSQRGISQYITEMEQKSFHGRSIVPSWDMDYRKLKRVRWLRNQIAHEASTTDCNEEDVAWLEEFHSRLLEQRNPLALLKEKEREWLRSPPRRKYKQMPNLEQRANINVQPPKREDSFSKEKATVPIWVAAVLAGLTVITVFLIFRWLMVA